MSALDHIYVIDLGLTVKVGRSHDPQRRLREHESIAAAHGVLAGASWVSRGIASAVTAETELIERCSAHAAPIRREYFPMPFETAVDEAVSIDLAAHHAAAVAEGEVRSGVVRKLIADIWANGQLPAADASYLLVELERATAADDERAGGLVYDELTQLRTDWRSAAIQAAILGGVLRKRLAATASAGAA